MRELILLAEDSLHDVVEVKRALKSLGVCNSIHVVSDGYQAVDYIAGVGIYGDRERFHEPGILFLDLIMPRADGWFVLNWLATKPEHVHLLKIVITGLAQSNRLRDAYSLGAQSFLTKPLKPVELKCLLEYWPERWVLKEPSASERQSRIVSA